jgi:hypothetical protein
MTIESTDSRGAERAVRSTPFSAIPSRSIRWLWPGRLARGYLTVQTGEEGLGKSVFAAWLLAEATRGRLTEPHGDPLSVVVVAGEDGHNDTWRPRLDLAGADLERVHGVTLPDEWNLRDGARELAAEIDKTNASLVYIDSAMDHMPSPMSGESINSPTYVRNTLRPLRRLVADRGIAGLFSLHPPKAKGNGFRDMVQASQAFTAIPRVGLLFAYHPDDGELPHDDQRRVCVRGKGNIGRNPAALEYRIVEHSYRHDDGVVTYDVAIAEDVRPSDVTMADLRADRCIGARDPGQRERAVDELRRALGDHDWHPAAPTIELLSHDGLSKPTIHRAAASLRVEKRRTKDAWQWRLPTE